MSQEREREQTGLEEQKPRGEGGRWERWREEGHPVVLVPVVVVGCKPKNKNEGGRDGSLHELFGRPHPFVSEAKAKIFSAYARLAYLFLIQWRIVLS